MTVPQLFGSPVRLLRNFVQLTGVTLTKVIGTTPALDLSLFSGGSLYVPADGPTALSFYCSSSAAGTYKPFYDSDGIAVTLTCVEETWTQLPPALFAMPWTKLLITTGTDDTSDCDIYLMG